MLEIFLLAKTRGRRQSPQWACPARSTQARGKRYPTLRAGAGKAIQQRSLLAQSPQWGTTADFVAWEKNKVLVRIYNCAYPDDAEHPPDPGLIVSYDIRTKKISREH